jgi:hypothetical protein
MKNIKRDFESNKGFVRIIIILIIILVIINLAGLDAVAIWTGIFEPVFSFIGNVIVSVANFVVNLLRYAWDIVSLQN